MSVADRNGMQKPALESAWRRGWNDTKIQLTNWRFVVVNIVVGIALVLFGLFLLEWYWSVGLLIAQVLFIWVYETFTATRKQRDEARIQLTSLQHGNENRDKPPNPQEKLKGKFFHTFDKDGYVRQQGQIVDFVNDDTAIIQLFDWVLGQPSQRKIVSLEKMAKSGWAIYDSNEDMLYAYKYGHVKKRT